MKMADKVVDWLLKNGADEDKARIYTGCILISAATGGVCVRGALSDQSN